MTETRPAGGYSRSLIRVPPVASGAAGAAAEALPEAEGSAVAAVSAVTAATALAPASAPAAVSSAPFMTADRYYQQRLANLDILLSRAREQLNSVLYQRDTLNESLKKLKDELHTLQEPACTLAEVIRPLADNKCYVKIPPDDKVVVNVNASRVDPAELRPGLRVALKATTNEVVLILPKQVDPVVSLMRVDKTPDQTYSDIGGLGKQLLELREILELPLKHPEIFSNLGIPAPKGVILYGAPGCGKSAVARAVAHHCGCNFIRISGSELVSKYIGEGSRLVRQVFQMAIASAPSIIFIDECDSIGGKRSKGGTDGAEGEVNRTMMELLSQLDGFESSAGVKLIMATNRIDTLDDALLRPGRIDRKVEFPLPDLPGRVEILKIHSRKMNLVRGMDWAAVARAMHGASGSDCRAVCIEAGMFALRERRNYVVQQDFVMAAQKVMAWKEVGQQVMEVKLVK